MPIKPLTYKSYKLVTNPTSITKYFRDTFIPQVPKNILLLDSMNFFLDFYFFDNVFKLYLHPIIHASLLHFKSFYILFLKVYIPNGKKVYILCTVDNISLDCRWCWIQMLISICTYFIKNIIISFIKQKTFKLLIRV